MSVKTEFDFELSQPVKFHSGGVSKEGSLLVLKAPTTKHNKYRIKLQQGFFRAMKELNTGNADGGAQSASDTQVDGVQVLAMLLTSGTDMFEYQEDFKRLMFDGLCMVEGETPMTDTIYSNLSTDDADRMLGEYVANFIIASVLRILNQKS